MVAARTTRRLLKGTVLLLGMLPFLLLLQATINDQLGANPIQALHFSLGDWALRFLMIGLALTPIKIITQQAWPLRYRRMMGLLAFFMPAYMCWFIWYWICQAHGQPLWMKFRKVLIS